MEAQRGAGPVSGEETSAAPSKVRVAHELKVPATDPATFPNFEAVQTGGWHIKIPREGTLQTHPEGKTVQAWRSQEAEKKPPSQPASNPPQTFEHFISFLLGSWR